MNFFSNFRSLVKINVNGKNISRFINRLVSNNIEILSIDKLSNENINIIIYKKDYSKLIKIKTIYELETVDVYGYIKLKVFLKKNYILFLFLLIAFCFIFFISHVIFDVVVVYDKREVVDLLVSELKKYNIKPYHFVKSFDDIENIKNKILNDYKDKLEWIEIERVGVKYIVRVEERKIPSKDSLEENRDLIAKKSAIIKDIFASNGVVLKSVNNFVKKGDVIVSGNIFLNDKYMYSVCAKGEVFGEVWYKSRVEIPFVYNEKNYSSNIHNVFTLYFLNKRFELFNFNKFEQKQIEEKVLLYHSLLPIKFSFEKQRQIEIYDKIYTVDEATQIGVLKSIEAINNKLSDKEYIISSKKLKVDVKESKIVLDMFFSVYENITDYKLIEDVIQE